MQQHSPFEGASVYVAGGTSGINLAIAEAFAAAGARVAVSSRDSAKVKAAVEALESAGAATGEGFAADVRDYATLAAGIDAMAAHLAPLDIVVSGAAGNFPAAAADMSANAFKAVVDIDLLGTYNVFRACYPHMRRPGGSAIAVSAPQSTLPMDLQAHVCAAKAGVDMLTRCLALEWGPEGIRVNGVVPGPIEGTEGMARLAPSEKARQTVEQSVPLRRYGTPQDIANAVLLLSGPAAGYITGAVVPVDGGWSLGGASEAMARISRDLRQAGASGNPR